MWEYWIFFVLFGDIRFSSVRRRDSALIKEEIKSFLANRRISQAVVAQVTGESQLCHFNQIHKIQPGKSWYCMLASIQPLDENRSGSVPLSPGISQSRISHWLLQQGSDLSEQKKRAFFRWYQLEKTNPGNTSLPSIIRPIFPAWPPTPNSF